MVGSAGEDAGTCLRARRKVRGSSRWPDNAAASESGAAFGLACAGRRRREFTLPAEIASLPAAGTLMAYYLTARSWRTSDPVMLSGSCPIPQAPARRHDVPDVEQGKLDARQPPRLS